MSTTDKGRELGLNVDMLDVDFLRGLARVESPSTAARLRELADKLAQEVRDVGTLRSRLRDSYVVTYGPAMDQATFPYTVTGFVNAIDFAADKPGSTISNPNTVDLGDPTGFTGQEEHVESLVRNA